MAIVTRMRLILLIVVCWSCAGCWLFDDREPRRRGMSLSEASERSSAPERAEEPVPAREREDDHHHHADHDHHVAVATTPASTRIIDDPDEDVGAEPLPPAALADPEPPTRIALTTRVGVGSFGGDALDEAIFYTLVLEGTGDHFGLRLGLEVGDLAFEPGSRAEAGFEDPWTIGFDGAVLAHLFARDAAVVSPYLGAGLGIGVLNWRLRNELRDADGEVIRSDRLDYVNVGALVGVVWDRRSDLYVGVEGRARAWAFEPVTSQGFDDDLFESVGSVDVNLAIGYRF